EHHRDQRVAGIVAIAPTASDCEALAEVAADVPLVTVDGDPTGVLPLVTVDHEAGAHTATRHLLAAGHRTVWHVRGPADFYAANDHLALGVLRALHEHGRSVPRDVSVVGFDDVPEAACFPPPLTTIRPDSDAVAAEALDLLPARIADSGADAPGRTLGPALVERRTVAPPAARGG
ncbi:substrate-binding domain-containing protein, partial [Actinosynnema sp. NPDC059797]